jgi:hypothetical protein
MGGRLIRAAGRYAMGGRGAAVIARGCGAGAGRCNSAEDQGRSVSSALDGQSPLVRPADATRPPRIHDVQTGTAGFEYDALGITGVELLGRYSNRTNWTELPERLLQTCQSGRPEAPARRGTVRRLSPEQIAELVDEYNSGVIINDLAKHFKIHRTTVSLHLLRQGVRDCRRR